MPDTVEIYTDASYNPKTKQCGWGAVFRWKGNSRHYNGSFKALSSTQAELIACINALSKLRRQVCSVILYTDSQYVKRGITEQLSEWRRAGWVNVAGHAIKSRNLWRRLERLSELHRVRWRWIKGHNGNPHNIQADRLARQACKGKDCQM